MENETENPETPASEEAPAEAVPMNRAQKRAAQFHKAAEAKKGSGYAGGKSQAAGSAGAPPPKAVTRMKKG